MKARAWVLMGSAAACAAQACVPQGTVAAPPAVPGAAVPMAGASDDPRAVGGATGAVARETRGLILTGPGDAAPPPPDWGQVSLSLSVKAYTHEGTVYFVQPGAVLRTGDRLVFQVAVGRRAYVYLMQVFPDGHAAVLYPPSDMPVRLEPGDSHRIPTDPDRFFELDDVVGTEQVAVIASEQPLEGGAPELAQALSDVRTTGQWPSRTRPLNGAAPAPGTMARAAPVNSGARLPPDPDADTPESSGSTRGIGLSTGSSGRTLDVQEDASHVAAAWFRCKHVP